MTAPLKSGDNCEACKAVSDQDWDVIITALERLLTLPPAQGFPSYPDGQVEDLLDRLLPDREGGQSDG